MLRTQDTAPTGAAAALAALAACAVVFSGCSAESAATRRSKQVLAEQMSSKSEHAGYALSIAARSRSQYARNMIVQSVTSDNYATALEAVRAIADAPPAEAREALQAAFAARKGLLKLNAALALAKLGDETALAFVREEVIDRGAALTPTVVTLLAAGGGGGSLRGILERHAASDEPTVRTETYELLSGIREPWATELLLRALEREKGAEEQRVLLALGRTADASVAPTLERYLENRAFLYAALEALGTLGQAPSSAAVRKVLDGDENPLVRAFAATALWRLGDESVAAPAVEALTGADDMNVRLTLAQQLRGIRGPGVETALKRLLADPEASVRAAAVRSLALLRDPALQDAFAGALGDKSYEVATAAMDALAEVGTPEVVDRLAPLLDHPIAYVKMSAANAILSIEGAGA